MKDTKYLHNFPRFHPYLDLYEKLQNNPKIYKLAKLLSKSALNRLNREEKPKSLSIPKPRQKKPKLTQKETRKKITHLPKLPAFNDGKIFHCVEIYNLKLTCQLKNSPNKPSEEVSFNDNRKKSISISKGSMQNFNFSPLFEARNVSISMMPQTSDMELKLLKESVQKNNEKSEEKQRKDVVYSKQKYNLNVQDFSSFFDCRDS